MPKKFYITTLGCPKNIADSSAMHESLLRAGLVPVKEKEEADYHFINTCTFIQQATEETIQTILDACDVKKQHSQKLVVVGCFAERYPQAIQEELPEVDLIIGTGKYNQTGELILEAFPEDFKNYPEFNQDFLKLWEKYSHYSENYSKPYSYIKISDGCNRGCAFCIIPSFRGRFKETPEDEILSNIDKAIQSGAKEICLVSQDTNYYYRDESRLASLLEKISQKKGVELIRPLYLYPDKRTYSLLDYFPKIPKIAPYLESPLQHVSSKVLKAMGRSGNYSFFKDLYEKARSLVPGIEIRTSFIIGFPGETKEDVEEICLFIQEVKPEKVNLFPYSPQEGTKGALLTGKPSDSEVAKRIQMVQDVYWEVLEEIQVNRIGKIYPAIIDEKTEEGTWVARRFQDAPEIDGVVYIQEGDWSPGQIGKVQIHSFWEHDMEGTWMVEADG